MEVLITKLYGITESMLYSYNIFLLERKNKQKKPTNSAGGELNNIRPKDFRKRLESKFDYLILGTIGQIWI